MPKLSLWRPNKTNDYNFFDRTISEMFTVGATDLYVHKYLGPTNQGPSTDYTQPDYAVQSPTNIQDLLFLENRDRAYDTNIYRLRGHYTVQNLDFDLSQFGLFLNNDIIFVTVHYNDMIGLVGRKLMVGDVIELPHLIDYNPLDETIQYALKRFMQVTDANYASEGFSPTWFPHLWRIKLEPLTDSEEFSQILSQPNNLDTYLGVWDNTKTYPAGYVITYGDKNYVSTQAVPAGVSPPDPNYWQLDTNSDLKDVLATYNKNIKINDAALAEAERLVPASGYDATNLFIVPTYGEYESNNVPSNKINQPAPPTAVVVPNTGSIQIVTPPGYADAPVVRISKSTLKKLQDSSPSNFEKLDFFNTLNIEKVTLDPVKSESGNGSGFVSGPQILLVSSMGTIKGPYGTADNTYATADQNPEAPNFTGTEPYGPNTMDYRADCDPSFAYIARSTPRTFGYSTGYMTGDGTSPNGIPTGAGISFPQNPQVGDYFLRIDYLPQLLYRWDGRVWVRISANVRTQTGFADSANQSQLSGFINNSNVTVLSNGTTIPQSQPLSSILTLSPDVIPPGT